MTLNYPTKRYAECRLEGESIEYYLAEEVDAYIAELKKQIKEEEDEV